MQWKCSRGRGHFHWRDQKEVAFQKGLEEWKRVRKAEVEIRLQMARRAWARAGDEESGICIQGVLTKGQGESKGPWSWQAEKTKLMSTVIYDTTLWSTERTDLLLKIQDQNRWLKNKNPQYHRDLLKSNHFITCYYCLFSCRSWVMILCAFNVYVHKHNFCSVLRSLTRKRNRGSHVSSLFPQSWWHGGMGGVACLFVFNYSLE